MKVVMFSLDESILIKGSESNTRLAEYESIVDRLDILLPSQKDTNVVLNSKVSAVGVGGMFKASKLIRMYFCARKILARGDVDLITSQDAYYVGICTLFLSRSFNIPFEIQVHGFEKLRGLRRLVVTYLLPKANCVRTVSERSKNVLAKKFTVNLEKMYALPVVDKIDSIASFKDLDQKKDFVFLTVGRLVSVKSVDLQLKAFSVVVKKKPHSTLWIVGDGPERKRLEELAEDLLITKKVVFWGWQSDVKHFYSKADAFLLTSSSEGWGRVVVEASAYSLPTIMTDVGLAGEFIVNNSNGIVIKKGSVTELRNAMENLVTNPEEGERLGIVAKKSFDALPTRKEILIQQQTFWECFIRKSQ